MKTHPEIDPSCQFLQVQRDSSPCRYTDAPTTYGPTGYVMEWCPTHPRAAVGVIFQHQVVMECHIGRFLLRGEVVHHINKVRHDNRIENLRLFSNHAEHMREHHKERRSLDPKLIEQVRKVACDPLQGLSSLDCSPTTAKRICEEQGIAWTVKKGPKSVAMLLSDASVREALQGRTTAEAAKALGVSHSVLYTRFAHLLQKRPSPGYLDEQRNQILGMLRAGLSRADICRDLGVNRLTLTKSIQRWKEQGAKSGEPVLQEGVPSYRGRRPLHKEPCTGQPLPTPCGDPAK